MNMQDEEKEAIPACRKTTCCSGLSDDAKQELNNLKRLVSRETLPCQYTVVVALSYISSFNTLFAFLVNNIFGDRHRKYRFVTLRIEGSIVVPDVCATVSDGPDALKRSLPIA